jgi:outer membrane immunogenic protein
LRKILVLTAVSAAALSAAPASAQAVSGPRIELLAGYDKVKIETNDLDSVDHFSDEGLVYGLGAGYDFAVAPSFSVGVDLEATNTSVEAVVTDDEDDGDRTRYSLEGGLDLYAGLRATVAATENILFYVKGGYTRWRGTTRVWDVNPDDPTDTTLLFKDRDHVTGWRAGAGFQFTNGFFYGGPEYRYSNYEDGITRHQVVLTAGLRFGPRAAPPPPPPVEAPPPPPPPVATQTCPDGTVIPATDTCPAPPPPPPPPPSGERG